MTNSASTPTTQMTETALLDRSNLGGLDHAAIHPTVLPRASSAELNSALCAVEIDEAREHHLALAMAVIELAADAGSPFPWGHDDPTIALLRAAAKLSLTSPDATSSSAADLVERLTARGSSTR